MKTLLFILMAFLHIVHSGLHAQTTITLVADYDAALGYHTSFSSQANTNWSTATTNAAFIIPGATGGTNGNRALIHFNLSQIPPCVQILSAELSLYGHGPHGSLPGHSGTNNSAFIRRVIQPWNVSTVTWNNQPTATTHNQVTIPAATSATQDYLNINVTQLVQAMVDSANFGFQLRLVNETPTNSLIFASDNFADSLKHPRLQVTYVYPCPQHVFHLTSICEGDSIWLQGAFQKTAGVYYDTLTGLLTLDSVLVTALTLNPPTQTIQTHTICDGDSLFLAGAWRKTPGFYTHTLTGSNGCDSIVHHQLTITIIDVTVTLAGSTLTATQTGATYQWIDCEQGFTPVAGATGQHFTPTINGSYAVIISKDGCIGVSPCTHVGNISVPEHLQKMDVRLVPNPAGERVTLMLEQQIKEGLVSVNNLSGQQIMHTRFSNTSTLTMDINTLPAGMYLVFIQADGYTTTRKLVVR